MPLKKGTKVMTIDGAEASKKMLGRIKNTELGSNANFALTEFLEPHAIGPLYCLSSVACFRSRKHCHH